MIERDLVFVSYSHVDKTYLDKFSLFMKPWIRRGLNYWADDYIRSGDKWKRVIDDAIGRARVAVLLVSPNFLASEFIRDEELPRLTAAADASELRLFCIAVSACTHEAVGLDVYQFANEPNRPLDGMSESEQHQIIVRIVREVVSVFANSLQNAGRVAPSAPISPVLSDEAERLGELHGLPELPPHYLPRPAELDILKREVLGGNKAAVSVCGIQGLGGIGKTVLATALARDEEIRRAFPDGIYFVQFGQDPELVRLSTNLVADLLDAAPQAAGLSARRAELKKLMQSRRCLLILDDLWQHEHALMFRVLGPQGRMVITTRDHLVATVLGATSHDLGPLDPEAAMRMLAEGSGQSLQALPASASGIVRECGYLPLAVALAAAQVRAGVSFSDVHAALKQGKLEFLDHPYGSVWKSLGASVHALSDFEAARYHELAISPEDASVPADVVARLWQYTAKVQSHEAMLLLDRFAARSMLYLEGDGTRRGVRFHDLQRDYLGLVEASRMKKHHGNFLDASANTLPKRADGSVCWESLPQSEYYMWKYLSYHFRQAGREQEAHALVTNVPWLAAKLQASGASELLVELDVLLSSLEDEGPQRRILAGLRSQSRWLLEDPAALSSILYNSLRAASLTPPEISDLLPSLRLPATRLRYPVLLNKGGRLAFLGHRDLVSACVYSPDGTRVLSASWDNTMREWDARTGAELRCFAGHSDGVLSCAYNADGKRALSASWDNTVREWNVETGDELQCFMGHTAGVYACTYSADAESILTASEDGTVRKWDVRTGELMLCFTGHMGPVFDCIGNADGTHVLSASADKTVREWDAHAGHELRRFIGHSEDVYACAYSADEQHVLSASEDGTVREWIRARSQEKRCFRGHWAGVNACSYSPDGRRVLSASSDLTVRERDVSTGVELRCIAHWRKVYACRYSPDGSRVLSASEEDVREWDRHAANHPGRLVFTSGPVVACAYSPNGGHVLSAADAAVQEWDVASHLADTSELAERRRFVGHRGAVTACAYSPDGTRVLSASEDLTILEFHSYTGALLGVVRPRHAQRITACAYSPDGKRVLTASADMTMRAWDSRPRLDWKLNEVQRYLIDAGYSDIDDRLQRFQRVPHNRYRKHGRGKGMRWRGYKQRRFTHAGRELQRFIGHFGPITACAHSPDGTRVLSASEDMTVREWDALTGEEVQRFAGHHAAVTACAYSADGTRVLSASADMTLREWDTRTGVEIRRFAGHTAKVSSCTYCPDGRRVLSASDDMTIKMWSAELAPRLLMTIYGVAAFSCIAAHRRQFAAGDELGNVWILDCDDYGSPA